MPSAADLERRAEAPRLDAQPARGPRAGSPTCTSSQSITAARPCSSTMTLPMRRSPCTIVVAVRGGRLATQPVVRLLERRAAIVDAARSVAQYCVERVGVARRPGTSAGSMRVQAGEEPAEIVDEHVARASANSSSRRIRRASVSPGTRRHHQPGGAEQRAVVVDEHLGHAQAGPAARARIASASQPHRARQPGPARRVASQDQRRVRRRVNDHVSRDAPPLSRCSPSMSTGAEDRRERGREPLRCRRWCRRGRHRRSGRGTPTGRRPSRSPHDQRVMPSVMRVTMPSRRLRSGMFDHTSPSTS